MTPRAYWDRHGFLWEENSKDGTMRVVWWFDGAGASRVWWPITEAHSTFGPMVAVA